MEQIPTEVMEKIENYIKSFGYTKSEHGKWKIMYDAAEFGYRLASPCALCEGNEKEITELKELLKECEDYFDNKADADFENDTYVPNAEMALLSRIRNNL